MAGTPRTEAARGLRRYTERISAAAEVERQHHRTRDRARGDRSRSFWEDDDRFALALMASIRDMDAGAHAGMSEWAAARQAAALLAPGAGQRVFYVHRVDRGVVRARPVFNAGPDRHVSAARRLCRKQRALAGVPAAWVLLAGTLISLLNSPVEGRVRQHAWALLGLLGWRQIPRSAHRRLIQLLTPSKINGLADVSYNDVAGDDVDDRGRSQSFGSRRSRSVKPSPAPILNTIEVTKNRLGCGRTKVLDLVKAKDLEAVKLGRRTLITEASIEMLVNRLPRVGAVSRRNTP